MGRTTKKALAGAWKKRKVGRFLQLMRPHPDQGAARSGGPRLA